MKGIASLPGVAIPRRQCQEWHHRLKCLKMEFQDWHTKTPRNQKRSSPGKDDETALRRDPPSVGRQMALRLRHCIHLFRHVKRHQTAKMTMQFVKGANVKEADAPLVHHLQL